MVETLEILGWSLALVLVLGFPLLSRFRRQADVQAAAETRLRPWVVFRRGPYLVLKFPLDLYWCVVRERRPEDDPAPDDVPGLAAYVLLDRTALRCTAVRQVEDLALVGEP